ncbi:MAG: hydroxymethylglutaryl-CoA lyase, partial [Acidimicrobiaceae bacterium]|nr:hydroxymethylglutaryl-CoA lyase [Acidimicrobiaceae bacterium]
MPSIELVEVSPRDGLQNDDVVVGTDTKIELIDRAIAAGVRRIEVASFVDPRRVPQMADAEAVLSGLGPRPDVSFIGLVLNARGFERALAAGVDEVNFVVLASDTFNQRNQGATTAESLAVFDRIAALAVEAGTRCSVTVGASFGCPFEGEVPIDRIRDVVARLEAADEISLADTIGVAVPTDVTERVAVAEAAAPGVPLRAHFHNTRNTGLANVYAALRAGAEVLDASVGGVGGCPFAPGAAGNIPTEDTVYMLHRMGVATGYDLGGLIATAGWLSGVLGKSLPGMVSRA